MYVCMYVGRHIHVQMLWVVVSGIPPQVACLSGPLQIVRDTKHKTY